ncbi:hypothetical protein DS885_06830 [Psychromonas sp. B3M02]|uniref:hypothetical protein n=2 Tax=unclassified Psychromonas TaxID=2614957 RepID=UPI000DEBBC83|nr:hypothetical protein [Psychromonas sp. B3M02]RBW46734.1 hypothetical protein DS885_06830 [Psychromonas sp. B3M02]
MLKVCLMLLIASLSFSVQARQGEFVRCLDGLASLGDIRSHVDVVCGKPLQIYKSKTNDGTKIQQAVYKIKGKLYTLTYLAGKLTKIEFA